MLFRNLKSGNLVDAHDETAIDLMRTSPIYEAVCPALPAESVSPASAGKSRKKAAKNESDSPADLQRA